ncbi:MAG: hypothetical protein ACE5GW_12680, partial [Planctomycetota bacterium]
MMQQTSTRQNHPFVGAILSLGRESFDGPVRVVSRESAGADGIVLLLREGMLVDLIPPGPPSML